MLRFKTLVCLSVATMLLSACAAVTDLKSTVSETLFGPEETNPPAELVEIEKPKFTPKTLWSLQLDDAEGYDFTPILDGGFVYAASAGGEIVKIDATTGKLAWRVDTKQKLTGGVGAGANLIFVGTAEGDVLAYDLTGALAWKSRVSSEVLSVPKVSGSIVVVRAGDSHIFGLSIADGARKWVYERVIPALTIRSASGIAVDSGVVYAGFAGGKMVVIRAEDGRSGWEASVAQPKGATEIERIADITSLPVVDGPLVYAVAYQGRLAAVDRSNGKVVWNRDVSSYTGISSADAKIYLSHAIGSVYSLDYTNGKTFWRQGDLQNRKLTAPLPLDGVVAVGDLEGYIHFLSKEDGAFVARTQLASDPIMPQMIELSSTSFVAQSRHGSVYAVSIK